VTALTKRPPPPTLSESDARTLTDALKADALALQDRALDLYERGAHHALGYSSWGAYWEAEFGGGKAYGYRQVEAGRIRKTLATAESPIGDWKPNEAQARELARLNDAQAQRNAWTEAVGLAQAGNGKVTAADVRRAVAKRRPSSPPKQPERAPEPEPSRQPEPSPPKPPAEEAAALASCARRFAGLAGELDLAAACAEAADRDREGWRADWASLRDRLDELLERSAAGQTPVAAAGAREPVDRELADAQRAVRHAFERLPRDVQRDLDLSDEALETEINEAFRDGDLERARAGIRAWRTWHLDQIERAAK
jgi:hypothetical protein